MQCIQIDLERLHFATSRRYGRGAEEVGHLARQLLCFAGNILKAAAIVRLGCTLLQLQRSGNRAVSLAGTMLDRRESTGWTVAQKQACSQFLQNALLQHRGKGVDIEGDMGGARQLRIWWDGNGVLSTDRLGVQMEENPRQDSISALNMET